jgi:hypothetical protein
MRHDRFFDSPERALKPSLAASPGPHDADPLFAAFHRMIEQRKAGKI